jgi:ribose-phosphate pyrophosphokinase
LIADKLQMDFALIHKERSHHGPRGSEMMLVGDVAGKSCVIIDDMSDTADTICAAGTTRSLLINYSSNLDGQGGN